MTIFYDLEVKLLDARPAPKRRFLLHQSATFLDLHEAIQAAFRWQDCHMWEFEEPDEDEVVTLPKELPLSAYFGAAGERESEAVYLYDFGDEWAHLITLKGVVTQDAPTHWRKLTSGLHMAPPEDCGGTPGYERLHAMLKTGKDPWGELKGAEIKQHLKDYNLTAQDLTFSIATQRARFDVPLHPKRHAHVLASSSSAPSQASRVVERRPARASSKANRSGGAPRPNATTIKARSAEYLKQPLSRRELDVFDFIEDCLKLHRQYEAEDVRLALSSWLYALTLNEVQGAPLKLRKPAIHAAAVTCWLDATCGMQLIVSHVSDAYNVSSPSVKAAYLELCALMGDASLQQTGDALGSFYREVWAEELASEPREQPGPPGVSDEPPSEISSTPLPDAMREALCQLMANTAQQGHNKLPFADLFEQLNVLGIEIPPHLGAAPKAQKKTPKKKKP